MTISEIKSKIKEWIKTGIPKNVKSSNMRTLLTNLAIRQDVQEVGRLKVKKITGNSALEQEIGDRVTGIVEDTLIVDAIYLGGDVNLLSSYFLPDYYNPTQNEYANIPEMVADQANQTKGYLQRVNDASDDPDLSSGKGIYLYLGTTIGDLTDYIRLSDADLTGRASLTGTNKYPFTTTTNQTEFQIPNRYDAIEFNLGGAILFEGPENEGGDYLFDASTGIATTHDEQPSGLKVSIRGFYGEFWNKQRLVVDTDKQYQWNLDDLPKQIELNIEGNILFEGDDYLYDTDTGDIEIIEDYYKNLITTETRLEVSKIF